MMSTHEFRCAFYTDSFIIATSAWVLHHTITDVQYEPDPWGIRKKQNQIIFPFSVKDYNLDVLDLFRYNIWTCKFYDQL